MSIGERNYRLIKKNYLSGPNDSIHIPYNNNIVITDQ